MDFTNLFIGLIHNFHFHQNLFLRFHHLHALLLNVFYYNNSKISMTTPLKFTFHLAQVHFLDFMVNVNKQFIVRVNVNKHFFIQFDIFFFQKTYKQYDT